jgi:hypothetical protein
MVLLAETFLKELIVHEDYVSKEQSISPSCPLPTEYNCEPKSTADVQLEEIEEINDDEVPMNYILIIPPLVIGWGSTKDNNTLTLFYPMLELYFDDKMLKE